MAVGETTAEKLAARMLARAGVRAIGDTYVAAAAAYGMGSHDLADGLIKIAEAAEREWMRRAEVEARDCAAH